MNPTQTPQAPQTPQATNPPDPAYGMTRHLPHLSVAEARERITTSLRGEGFGILTEIDVRATLQQKLGEEFRPYVILGACNPKLAHKALQAELGMGLLLPCNVCVWQEGDGAVVSIVRPEAMFSVVNRPGLEALVKEATDGLSRALAALDQPVAH